ncbi:MAG: DUF1761 domain-containing protein [Vulcanimicrobiaceae bacterium]
MAAAAESPRMQRINHLAVIAAAVVYFLFGYIWYSLLFGGMWRSLEGMTATSSMPAPSILIGTFVLGLIIAYIMAIALGKAADNTAAEGMQFGLFMSIGLVATAMLIMSLNEGKPMALWAINAGYFVIGITIMGAIIGGWKKPIRA